MTANQGGHHAPLDESLVAPNRSAYQENAF